MERYSSTTSSRLGSLSSFDQDAGRTDSMSSITSTGNSPKPLRASSTSHTPTPVTPSSSQSLLSPSTFTYSTPIGNYEFSSTPQTPNSASSTQQHYSRGLSTVHSTSSSMLLESPPYSPGHGLDPPQLSQPAIHRRRTLFSHKRSKSNPPVHSVSQDDEIKDEEKSSYQEPVHGQYGNTWNRSSSPPSRSGSNSSMTSHSVYGNNNSPSSIHRNKHPQMRRISNMAPSFSQTISNDQLTKTAVSHLVTSGSESALCRQNTCPDSEPDMYPRSYSLAGMGTGHRSVSSGLYNSDVTSTSMVDLPVRLHASSSEHLDQIEEYGRPDSNKSRSVPRLTFMTVSVESDRGKCRGACVCVCVLDSGA